MRETLSLFILLLSASFLLFLSTFSFIYCMYLTYVSSFSSVSLSSYRWACFGQRVGPAAPVHPARVRQPPHFPLTHLRRRDLHLHGEQLQGHRWGVRWPCGVGWVCRVRWLSHPLKKTTHMPEVCCECPSNPSQTLGNEVAPHNGKAALNSLSYKSILVCKFGVIIEVFSARSHQDTKYNLAACHFNWNEFFQKFVCHFFLFFYFLAL